MNHPYVFFGTILSLWTLIAIALVLYRIVDKYHEGEWWEWVIAAPVLAIIWAICAIRKPFLKPRPPVVTSGISVQNNPPKKYCTQVRFYGDKGKYYYVNVFSDTEQVHEVYPK
jgi:hypothetical protein